MIQGFRPPHWLACAVLAAATLAPTASAYAGPFLTPARQATAPAAPDDPYEELAGSVAGVGRDRPGRPVGEPANPELTVASRPLLPVRPPHTGHTEPTERTRTTPPPPSPPLPPPTAAVATPSPPETAAVAAPSPPPAVVTALDTAPNDRAADLAAHILPLGTGFALMGLGLGYLGMRLRRGI
ncbi:hypothetical protein OG594_01385 [Streptomyces sp. NBC_01214]|uniref:hypothetical protein n=1 Tax=Streptomyces sp. NBC_01214 TaxID=2903777 RepID=UPI00224F329B|nr:hypothetical protein [Streptomyces sp. NBC_01214]MCX4800339.1 hypothetical protein [Streptomyces sp. NBC_01214]